MAALRPDQPKTAAASAIIGTPETQVTPRPGRYEPGPAGSPGSSTAMVAGLRKSYGAVQAVRGTSFAVEHGQIFALLGPNGVGKTYGGRPMCPHLPACPPADRPDRAAARAVAVHPEQGWSLLCNGVIVFDDLGEILPGGLVAPPPHRMARARLPAAA